MIDLEAIRKRDQDYNDIFEQQATMPKHIAHRLVAWPVADRRALLAYVDELRKVVWSRVYGPQDGDIELYPCVLCGYNGQGFYQPDKHPCAALERTP